MPTPSDGRAGTIAKAGAPSKGYRLVFDDHRDAPRGFGLCMAATGSKVFLLRYTIDGRQSRKTIGDWPNWGLEQARIEARRLLQQIQTGNDPLEEKRRRKDEPTIEVLAGEWLDRHATGLKSEKAIRSLIEGDLVKTLGPRKVSGIRRRHVIEVIEARADGAPRQAAHLLVYACKMVDMRLTATISRQTRWPV